MSAPKKRRLKMAHLYISNKSACLVTLASDIFPAGRVLCGMTMICIYGVYPV